MFIANAESNFRNAQVKQIAEKRRKRLDEEHDVDRELLQKSYAALDDMYRVTEKEELKKYSEIGKTARQYYGEQAARGVAKDSSSGGLATEKMSSTESLREQLMNKDEKGMEVSLIKGQGYEQVKVSQGAGTVPDPRVAGPSIFFDSRLDNVKKDEPYDPLIQAVGQRQKKLGSVNPDSEPAYLRGSGSSRKPPGFGKDSEALYEPESYVTDQEKLLQLTVERYNMINDFLNSFESKEKRLIASSLLQEILTLIEKAGIGHYNLLKLH